MELTLDTLKPAPGARKNRKRKGRGPGSGSGKTAGRGHKGARARSGYSRKRGHEGGQTPLSRRLPKVGFWHESRFPMAIVNLDCLDKAFQAGDEVTPESLVRAGLAKPSKGGVKILGRGELGKKLTVKANAFSAEARAKIEAAGGVAELIGFAAQPRRKRPRRQSDE